MCSSKSKIVQTNHDATPAANMVSDINGRPVLQPATSNRVLTRSSLKKSPPLPKSSSVVQVSQQPLRTTIPTAKTSSTERILSSPPTKCATQKPIIPVKNSKKTVGSSGGKNCTNPNSLVVEYSSAAIVDSPGSIAAARRKQVAAMQVQRKMKIAHYGRSKTNNYDGCSKLTSFSDTTTFNVREEKRCSFITPNSGLTN